MSITVTFTFATREEAVAFLAGTTVSSAPVAIDVQPIPAAAKVPGASPKKAAKAAKPDKPITVDDVRAALNKYNSEHGLKETIALLQKHGKASKVTDVAPDLYGAVIEATKA